MYVNEGIILTALGTVVTASGFALKDVVPDSCRNRIIGFGLAHIAIGSAELVRENIRSRNSIQKVTKAVSFR